MLNLNKTNSHLLALTGVIVLLGLLYCACFSSRSFWSENEAYYALGARSVLKGNFILPKIYGNEYADKPPLFFWWVAGVSALFGGVKEWTVRLANVISALAILAGLYIFARQWLNKWTALLTVIITGTTYEFWQQATQALTDITLTALLVCSWGAMFGILIKGFTWWRWSVMWGCIALAILTKGPIALILTAMIAMVFCWVCFGRRDGWARLRQLRPFSGAAVSIGPFAVWCIAIYIFIGSEPLYTIVAKHNIIRFLKAFDHQKPFWFYLHQLPTNMLPWSLLLPWVGWRFFTQWRLREEMERKPLAFAITVVAVIFIFFSLSSSKRDYYLLPLMPWLALIIADFLWQLLWVKSVSAPKSQESDIGLLYNSGLDWNRARLLIISVCLLFAGYSFYSGVVFRFLESYKSPKPLAASIEQATDEDDHLVIVHEKDPRILYYLHEKFTIAAEGSDDLQKQRNLMLCGQEVDFVVEDDDLENVINALGIPLYLEKVVNFRDDKFYVLTNEPKAGLKPVRRKRD